MSNRDGTSTADVEAHPPQGSRPERARPRRRHHFVPRFFLAGFAPPPPREQKLWCFDIQTGKQRLEKPDRIAYENSLYDVDVPGVKTDTLEVAFCELEGQAARVLREIMATQTVPRGRDFAFLMEFLAFAHQRVPQRHAQRCKVFDSILDKHADLFVLHPEAFQRGAEQARAEGHELGDSFTHATARRLAEIQLGLPETPNQRMHNMLEGVSLLTSLLGKRKWSLLLGRDGLPDLVCSDAPLVIEGPSALFAGFDMPDTKVMMPLNRRTALLGVWEERLPVIELTPEFVALLNLSQVKAAQRFVYSAEPVFQVLNMVTGKLRPHTEIRCFARHTVPETPPPTV